MRARLEEIKTAAHRLTPRLENQLFYDAAEPPRKTNPSSPFLEQQPELPPRGGRHDNEMHVRVMLHVVASTIWAITQTKPPGSMLQYFSEVRLS